MNPLKVLVLAIFAHLSPGAERIAEPAVVDAIVAVASDPKVEMTSKELAEMVTYDELESGASEHPRSWSWDSKAGVSCSSLQLPCSFVAHATVVEQHYYWLRELRAAGLASLDSSPTRAARREAMAQMALAAALAQPE
jgi:hypothetical protein